jgi:hypothetical protein
MREFGLTSRQYNAVRFSLDGMESSIVESRSGRIADLLQRTKALDVKIAKLRRLMRHYNKCSWTSPDAAIRS